MSDSGFYKCACENCREHLEFPTHAVGITTTCPHCGVETRLVAPAAAQVPSPATPSPPSSPPPAAPSENPVAITLEPLEPPSAGSKLKRALNIVGSVVVGLAVLGYFGWKGWRAYRKGDRLVEAVKTEPSSPAAKDAPSPVPKAAPPVAVPATSIVLATGAPPARKPGEDLQILSFEIHKAKDGNLQYIVGVVTNHAAKQYFNVKLTFDLTRQGGKTGDTATDTLRNLPANVGSTFKVNIIGTTPVTSAKLAKLEGDIE